MTAAGQGIGRASAMMFAKEGAQVLATDINAQALATLAETAGVRTLRLDVTDANAVAVLAREEAAFDALFNCAGFVHAGSILECSEDDWAFSWQLNVTSMYRLTRALLPKMLVADKTDVPAIGDLRGFRFNGRADEQAQADRILMGDGSVRQTAGSINLAIFRAILTPSGGESVTLD